MVKNPYCVSVVVPTYKRPDMLVQCLTALLEQEFDATAYEVIIVDDAASDETRQMVTWWSERVRPRGKTLRYVAMTGRMHGPAAARNAGWRVAHGEIIAFTDDDCIPTSQWLRAGVEAFTPDVIGAAGRLIMPLRSTPTDYERNAAQLAHSEFITANCFYRRACLAAVGGFDERFSAAWREDTDLFFTLYKGSFATNALQGTEDKAVPIRGTFAYAPGAVVIHPIRPARWGISLSQQRKSMYNALLYKKHPELYRQKVQAAPPWRYYGIAGALLAWIGAILGKKQGLAFGAACLWMLLTGNFCLQRLRQTSRHPGHVAEMLVTSALIPPLAIFWRLRGAMKFRVWFL
ncbi:MAG TPA: glycosyltransferase [Ktedonobacteraceae bacterium]|nr:glycosyltransferase [Ktedonobacteraceae bacterium]